LAAATCRDAARAARRQHIRFVRWIDMDRINRSNTQAEHRVVVE
jgi:hypothetical protein